MHNVMNALATIAIADELGVDPGAVKEGLRTFGGVQRRFTVLGEAPVPGGSVTVVDDYAHHPSEVVVTLEAAQRAYKRRIVVAFQPHRYSRTLHLFDELTRAFNRADLVFMTDVYAAGEKPMEGATTERLCAAVRAHGHRNVNHVPLRTDLVEAMRGSLQPEDVVLTMGAGDITKTGPELIAALKAAE